MYLIVARQRLCKKVTAATNTHATIEVLLDIVFCAVHVLSRKGGHSFFPEFLSQIKELKERERRMKWEVAVSQIKESRLLLLAVPARTAQRKFSPFFSSGHLSCAIAS
jgi:hypothetical protein